MTPERFNEIEALALGLLDEARLDIENTRAIYDALRDALLAVLPLVNAQLQARHPGRWLEQTCCLPSLDS